MTTRRTLKALLIPLLYLLLICGVNAFDDGAASATESHVTATCSGVTVFATDHGQTATVTDAYVLDAAGTFNGGATAALRTAFVGTVLSTGPDAGAAGPSVTKPSGAPAGSWTFAITLTFSGGFVSTGTATATLPCETTTTTTTAATTTTVAPTTTAATTSTTAATTTTPTDPTTSTTVDLCRAVVFGCPSSTTVITLPRTGSPDRTGQLSFGALLLVLVGILLVRRGRRPEPIPVRVDR